MHRDRCLWPAASSAHLRRPSLASVRDGPAVKFFALASLATCSWRSAVLRHWERRVWHWGGAAVGHSCPAVQSLPETLDAGSK